MKEGRKRQKEGWYRKEGKEGRKEGKKGWKDRKERKKEGGERRKEYMYVFVKVYYNRARDCWPVGLFFLPSLISHF